MHVSFHLSVMASIRTLLAASALLLVLAQASSAIDVLSNFAQILSPATTRRLNEAKTGFRVELTHVDAFMDPQLLNSPQRLKRAVDASQLRLHALAKRMPSQITHDQKAEASAPAAGVFSPGFINGAYLVTLALGTPPQVFTALLDTGSDICWRQSDPCYGCYNQSGPVFHPNASSTFKFVPCNDTHCIPTDTFSRCSHNGTICEYGIVYADYAGSTGNFGFDTLTIGGYASKEFVFGAGTTTFGSFLGAGGLLGMGGGTLSLPSQMAATIENKFSYCLVNWFDAPSKTSPLLFGSSANLQGDGVQSTPIVSNGTLYYITLKAISVDGKLLDIPPGTFDIKPDGTGGTFIDSGTTITYLPDAAYTPLRRAYHSSITLTPKNGSSVQLDLCYEPSSTGNVIIPSLTFHFDGADVELPPGNIFVNYQGYFCLAILSNPFGDFSVFGNTQQQNFHILYDKGPDNKLSFKPAACDSL